MAEENLAEARNQLWRSRGRRSRELGSVLLAVSVLFFVLAYLTRYLVFEGTSIIALFLGLIFLFTGMESYVKTKPSNAIAEGPLLTLKGILDRSFRDTGRSFYYESRNGVEKLAYDSRSQNFDLVLAPHGDALLRVYEEEIGDLTGKGLDYIVHWLPKVIVEGLKLAEEVEFSTERERVSVTIKGPSFESLCISKGLKIGICDRIGCQVQASIGQAISKATAMKVFFGGCTHDDTTNISMATYVLTPSIDLAGQHPMTRELVVRS